MIDAGAVLDSIAEYTQAKTATSANRINRIAVIDPAYSSGRPRVTFEGDTTLSASGFVFLPGYSPAAGDRVVMYPLGNTYVIGGLLTDVPVGGGGGGDTSGADQAETSAAVSTSSTSYVALTGNPGTEFVAPESGVVLILIKAAMACANSGATACMTFQVREGDTVGSGTVFFSAQDDCRISGPANTQAIEVGAGFLVTGLTAGADYNVQAVYKREGGSGDATFSRRRVVVMPSNGIGGGGGGGGVTDHGALTGLADDDHTQYHNDTRGDARYSLLAHNHTGTYQPLDSDLTTIGGLSPANGDFIQRVAGAWSNRAIAQVKADLAIAAADLTATGTRDATTFLRGDNTWAVPSGGGGATDHGALTGLSDDDHTQYHTDARGDARYQPLDSDLTAVAGLSPSNDDIIQRKSGAWTNRTMAQLATDLGIGGASAATWHDVTSSDQSVTNSTTRQNSGLSISGLPTTKRFRVECYLVYESPTAADMRCKFDVTNADLTWTGHGPAESASAVTNNSIMYETWNDSDIPEFGGLGAGKLIGLVVHGALVTTGSGTLTFTFAQATATSSTSVILKAGSWMTITQLD